MPPKENLMDDIPTESQLLDDSTENKVDITTPEPSPENKEPTEPKEPEGEENLPFHKHPRWKKMQEDREALAERNALYEKEIEDLKQWKETVAKSNEKVTLPDWWKQSYGEDDNSIESYKSYSRNTETYKEQIKSEVKREIEEDRRKEIEIQKAKADADAKKIEESQEYIENSFKDLKTKNPDVDKNELFKFILDYQKEYGSAPVDNTGNYDLSKAYSLMNKLNPKSSSIEAKKQIASQSMSSKTSSSRDNIPVVSRDDLRRGDWKNIIRNNQ